jgi:hypothetical protein
MHWRGLSLWLFRLSLVSFALAWVLPIFPSREGFLVPGAWAFFAAPFITIGFWVAVLFNDFDRSTLVIAMSLTVVTAMNCVFIVAPFLRQGFAERPFLVAWSAGISTLAASLICHLPPGSDQLLPVWSPVEFAWITSYVLMSASGVAGCFAGVPEIISCQSRTYDD